MKYGQTDGWNLNRWKQLNHSLVKEQNEPQTFI